MFIICWCLSIDAYNVTYVITNKIMLLTPKGPRPRSMTYRDL